MTKKITEELRERATLRPKLTTITKEQARELIKEYSNPRRAIVKDAITRWKNLFNLGKYKANIHMPIRIDCTSGKPLTGIHRLEGFVKSDAEKMKVYYVLDELSRF